MAARKFHGIKKISFGTTAAAKTALAGAGDHADVTDIDTEIAEGGVEGGDASAINFLDQEGNPTDSWGNQLSGVQYVEFVIRARDLDAFDALTALWKAGTPIYWRFILDNDERWHTDTAVGNFTSLMMTSITARFQGVSDQFIGRFMVPFDEITVTTT